ncbi:MAG: MlaD family protein [Bacteroidetes bacterium]|nr:MlaD family protein [Bacteroidota bacterium]
MKKSYAALLGLFISVGILILAAGIFLVGERQGIFTQSTEVLARFNSVEGLKKGAAVRLLGIDVGTVSGIRIWNNVALVDLRIFSDSRKFIKKDSKAMLETEGLVGNKFVVLTPGTEGSASVQALDTLNSIEEPNLSQIIIETRETIASVKNMVDQFSGILADVRQGRGTLGKLVTDESVYYALKNATYEADSSLKKVSDKFSDMAGVISGLGVSLNKVVGKTDSVLSNVNYAVKNFDTTASNIKFMVAQLDTGQGLVASLIHNRSVYDTAMAVVSTTLAAVKEAQIGLQKFAGNMEALRHNWLFSSYFAGQAQDEYTKKEQQLRQIEEQIKVRSEQLDKMEGELKELQEKLGKAGGKE